MIEVDIRQYLVDELKIPVLFERPKTKTVPCVLMQIIDEGYVEHIPAMTISFTISHTSFYNAKVLADQVKGLLLNAITLEDISKASLGGVNSTTDSERGVYEYELIFNFIHY
jgi:hypothetical protein